MSKVFTSNILGLQKASTEDELFALHDTSLIPTSGSVPANRIPDPYYNCENAIAPAAFYRWLSFVIARAMLRISKPADHPSSRIEPQRSRSHFFPGARIRRLTSRRRIMHAGHACARATARKSGSRLFRLAGAPLAGANKV